MKVLIFSLVLIYVIPFGYEYCLFTAPKTKKALTFYSQSLKLIFNTPCKVLLIFNTALYGIGSMSRPFSYVILYVCFLLSVFPLHVQDLPVPRNIHKQNVPDEAVLRLFLLLLPHGAYQFPPAILPKYKRYLPHY